MTTEERQKYIGFLRENGFNCFPIESGHKIADWRYKAEETTPNQDIKPEENFGYIPIRGAGTAIIDYDDKELFSASVKDMISKGVLTTESPHGWHNPIVGLTGEIGKIRLYFPDKPEKPALEIQGPKQYCVGPGSEAEEGNYEVYDGKILNAKGMDFHEFVDYLAKKYELVGPKKNASTAAHLRQKFLDGKPPSDGQSNDYFFNAALQCNTDGLSIEDAMKKIEEIYEKWKDTKFYSHRPWSNIEAKINEVYEKDLKIKKGGNRKKNSNVVDIAKEILENNILFSDGKTRELYKTENGFLENVTIPIQKTITKNYETTRSETSEVLHYLVGLADELPPLNYDYVMFKNGMYDLQHNIVTEKDNDIICAIGFKNYNYIDCPKCPRFLDLIEKHVDNKSLNNLKACLSSVIAPEKQIRMSVLYGPPGTGKTTLAETLTFSIGDAACAMKVDDFFNDRATEARVKGKTLLYFQDTPRTWKDWSKIKVTTGENELSIRDMYQKGETIRNMLSVIISSNHLIEIDEDEEAPMFDRLALIFFHDKIRGTPQDNQNFAYEVSRDEGEDIVSYCLNLRKEGYKFDPNDVVKSQWNEIIKPEEILFKEHFYYVKGDDGISIHEIIAKLREKYPDITLDIEKMQKVIKKAGFTRKGDDYIGVTYRSRSSEGLAC